MGNWGTLVLATVCLPATALAQADVSATAPTGATPAFPAPLGYAAMPGGLRAPSADTLPAGVFAVAALGGYGIRNTLLSADHKMTRSLGDLAFAFAPTDLLTLAVSFDGRHDKHAGVSAGGDDGYVGDPHVLARLAKRFGTVRAGAQLGVWVPGKDAPSVAASAISVDARALVSLTAGPALVSFSGGFRLDNSVKSIDNPGALSVEDQVSLGVSDWSAVVGSAHVIVPAGKAFVGFEASADIFVGADAPSPILRAGANAGLHVNATWSVFAFVQGAKVPGIAYSDAMAGSVTLVPYEPIVTGGVAVGATFGGKRALASPGTILPNPKREPVAVVEYAELIGTVTDDAGKPIAGAKVTVRLENTTGTGATDGAGRFAIAKLPIGKTVDRQTTLDDTGAELTVEVDGKKPKTTTLVLVKGANAVPPLALDPVLPPGQLRAVIRAAGTGKPIANVTVKIEPGNATATSDADGNISIDLPPGTYKATATGAGFKAQTLDVVIEKDGVVVKNFELRK